MRLSYSRIGTFKTCPYQFKLRYIDELKVKFNLDPANALVLGTAVHTGIEQDTETAIKGYYDNYPSATELMINEAIKLEVMINKARAKLPRGIYEFKLETEDFLGFIDLLVEVEKGVYDLYDFKYSNNVENYLQSGQLHVYKYFFESLGHGRIRDMYFVFIPKIKEKQEEYEDLKDYRKRLIKACEESDIRVEKVNFDYKKVVEFLLDAKHCIECEDYQKNKNKLCYWCDYKKYCESNGEYTNNLIMEE